MRGHESIMRGTRATMHGATATMRGCEREPRERRPTRPTPQLAAPSTGRERIGETCVEALKHAMLTEAGRHIGPVGREHAARTSTAGRKAPPTSRSGSAAAPKRRVLLRPSADSA
jgi:hypothetical protein